MKRSGPRKPVTRKTLLLGGVALVVAVVLAGVIPWKEVRRACLGADAESGSPWRQLICSPTRVPFPPVAEWLRDRAAEERKIVDETSKVFTGFRFRDQRPESGITFQNQVTEDSRRDFKSNHYDHGNGLAVADVDGDGRPDIYFVSQMGGNELWRNLGPDSTGQVRFENITERAGVGLGDRVSVSAAFADIDNDGRPDLFVTSVRGGNTLFHNDGNGRFTDITRSAGVGYVGHSSGAVFFDYDGDGLLDLLVVNVGTYTRDVKGPGGYYVGYSDSFFGHLRPDQTEPCILYKNLGKGRFRDVTREMRLGSTGWSGDATALDLNGDGFPDLYVTNMQGDDHFFLNHEGKYFEDVTERYFPKTPWGAMGVKSFDFNNDGRMDLLVTDMHSDMMVTEDPLTLNAEKLKVTNRAPSFDEAYLQGSANNVFGNAFYVNQGDGHFLESSDRLGAETYWPWGVSVGDLNADGFSDVFVTAGMGIPFRYGTNSVLLNNRGAGFFNAEFALGVEPRRDGRTEKPWYSLDCANADWRHEYCRYCRGNKSERDRPPGLDCAAKDELGRTLVKGSLSSRSSALVDLDGDGDLDIVTNDFNGEPQILISDLAQRKKIHWLKIKLKGTRSNADGLGARVTVEVADDLILTQVNDGKSGYLSQSSIPLYFGLGDHSFARRIQVKWPSGRTSTLAGPIAENRELKIVE